MAVVNLKCFLMGKKGARFLQSNRTKSAGFFQWNVIIMRIDGSTNFCIYQYASLYIQLFESFLKKN